MPTATDCTSITITVPIPPDLCDPNKRTTNFHVRAAHIAKAREDARLSALATVRSCGTTGLPWDKAAVFVKWYHKTVRFRDVQNIIATLKATIDGFEDAGIFKNDRELEEWKVKRLKDAACQRVEITLTRDS